ncbi:MAG: hypothetical protein LQ342_008519 [Letrouitia transgressa]|nr:MAG: hypothetical protein LQ342_008519 [Letrouitia transgressa]
MRVLDRSFFKSKYDLAAACVLEKTKIQQFQKLLRNDILRLDRYLTVRPAPPSAYEVFNNIRDLKCFLLKPSIRLDDKSTWSLKLLELVQSQQIHVAPYDLVLDYDYWTYHDILSAVLPEAEQDELPTGFSVVGHIAHLNLRDQYLPYKHTIAAVIMDKSPTIRTVINKTNDVGEENEFRTFKYELLAGKDDMDVVTKEQDCLFEFDYSKVYWNTRLGTEHHRIVEKFLPGEAVCDVMAGVGPFAVPAGKKRVFVLANDLNPESHKSLLTNIARNKVSQFVQPFQEDGREFIKSSAKLLQQIDRDVEIPSKTSRIKSPKDSSNPQTPSQIFTQPKVFSHYVMNLPASALTFLPSFIGLYANQKHLFHPHTSAEMPWIHVYCFSTKSDDNMEEGKKICSEISEQLGHVVKSGRGNGEVEMWDVRDVAPNKRMFCASFKLPEEVAFREVKE